MKLEQISNLLEQLKVNHDLDGTDLIIINTVNKLGVNALVTRVMKEFQLASKGTTHSRIKKLIKLGFLKTELDDDNQRTKQLVMTGKLKEVLCALKT
jgi:DNA-binding MarR family transcriptional regulator